MSSLVTVVLPGLTTMSIMMLLLAFVIINVDLSLGLEYRAEKNRCEQHEMNSRCTWPKMDGFCWKFSKEQELSCILPKTRNYLFTIESAYLPGNAKYRGKVKKMFIRGSGPGLTWKRSIQMKKSATNLHAWTVDINYYQSSDGLTCTASNRCSISQGALEFRIFTDESAKEPMKGPNFYIKLPVSNSLSGSGNFLKPKVTVYPWFNEELSTQHFLSITHRNSIGVEVKTDVTLFYPPSYYENTFRRYPIVVLLQNGSYIPQFEYLSVHASLVEEVIVMIVNPLSTHFSKYRKYFYSMLPFDTLNLECKTKSCTKCQVCWDKNRVEPCEKQEFIARSKKCLNFKATKGVGEMILNDIIHNLIGQLKVMTNDRIKYDPPYERTTIIGYAETAVTALIIGLTRPDIIANVGSLSPKFSLPLTSNYKMHSYILDRIDRLAILFSGNIPLQSLYSSQKYYISHGENDDVNFPLKNTYQVTEEVITKLKEKFKFKDGTNLMFHEFPDEELLSYPNNPFIPIISSIQPLMMFFHRAQGGATDGYPRTISLSEQFFADQKLLSESIPTQFPQSIVIPEGASIVNGNIVDSFGYEDTFDDGIEINQCSPLSSTEVPITIFIGSIGK